VIASLSWAALCLFYLCSRKQRHSSSDTTLTQPPLPSRHVVAPPGPSLLLGPKSPRSSTPLGSSTHSLLGDLPCTCDREIGPREIARLTVLFRGKQTPNPDGQRSTSGNVHSRHEPCPFDFPSTEFRSRASTLPGLHYASGPHTATSFREFTDRGTHDSKSFTLGNPERRNSDTPDSCRLSLQEIDGPNQIEESRFAISTCMKFLHSPT